MDDFETFKASREKMDPTSRKFSDSQWQQAYVAYRNSRERVSEGRSSKSGEGSRRRRGSGKSSSRKPMLSGSPTGSLRSEVRHSSAYADVRMIVDLLAWIAIGVLVLTAIIQMTYLTNGSIALASIMGATFKVIAVVVLRLLAHVIIDIPDIALHERAANSSHSQRSNEHAND